MGSLAGCIRFLIGHKPGIQALGLFVVMNLQVAQFPSSIEDALAVGLQVGLTNDLNPRGYAGRTDQGSRRWRNECDDNPLGTCDRSSIR